MVGGVFLVAEHGQAFLQRQLEPVAAGDAVAGPVVEILVGDTRSMSWKSLSVAVSGRASTYLVLKMLRPLFSIAPDVEIAHGRRCCTRPGPFQAVGVLVPFHRVLERLHGEHALIQLAAARRRTAASPCARTLVTKLSWLRSSSRRHDREQVGGLGERVDPSCPAPPAALLALGDEVAVRQQHRIALAARRAASLVARHHVGTVQEGGDPAEALRLAA